MRWLAIAAILTGGCAAWGYTGQWTPARARAEVQRAKEGFPALGLAASAESRKIVFDGVEHMYLVQPVKAPGRHPVVVLLHGGGGSASVVWGQTSLPTLAAKEGFILVAPNSTENGHWDDGRAEVLGGRPSHADDTGYLKAVIAEVVARDGGDANAVFMVGISNGGFMTIHFACVAGDVLRAAAEVSADLPAAQAAACPSRKPLPWLSIHGDHDPVVPFGGMAAGAMRNGRAQPEMFSAERTFAFFADRAGCATALKSEMLPDVDTSDNSRAERRVRSGCVGGTTSTQYVMHGAGHSWPGGVVRPLRTPMIGVINEDVDAGTVVWAHFRQTLGR